MNIKPLMPGLLIIVKAIINENKEEYSFIEEHFNNLYVVDRNCTGVGVYTNFGYKKEVDKRDINAMISADKSLFIEGCENALTFLLDITDGKINYLEIVTNGDDELMEKDIYSFKLI